MSKDLIRATEVRSTLNSPGWLHLDRLAEDVVRMMEREALAEEEEARIVPAQREARAARKFLERFRREAVQAGSAEPAIEESILVAM